MPGLYVHPKTKMFWIRRRVPAEIASVVKKRLIQKSLGTKDRRLAETLYFEQMGDLTRAWTGLASRGQSLSERSIRGLAGEFYRFTVQAHQDNPGDPKRWDGEVSKNRVQLTMERIIPGRPRKLFPKITSAMDDFLHSRGVDYQPRHHIALASAFLDAQTLAYRHLSEMARGNFGELEEARKFPILENVGALGTRVSRQGNMPKAAYLSVATHWEEYVKASGISLGTQKRFRPIILKFSAHIGNENLSQATDRQIEDWIEKLKSENLTHKTISEAYLSAVRAFYAYGVRKKFIGANPFKGVSLEKPKITISKAKRPQGLTDEESRLVLSETLRDPDSRLSPKMAAARRWIPWICAYTGSRVNEVTQLRKEDVSARKIGDLVIWVIEITPDAGTVKDREARDVPLHPHLIEQGFGDWVRQQGSGPLFYNPVRPRGGSVFNPPYRKVGEKLAEWVRDIGVSDERVASNHGWRHRLNTVSRRIRIVPEIRDSIVGHAPRTVGEGYGDFEIEALYNEILQLPRYDVQKPVEPRMTLPSAQKRSLQRKATAARAKERKESSTDVMVLDDVLYSGGNCP
jgi:integrase